MRTECVRKRQFDGSRLWKMVGNVKTSEYVAVGLVSCSVCANSRHLWCAIWAAALRTATGWRCCRLHWVLRVLGEVTLQGLCHCRSHGGLLDQGVPEEAVGGLVCVAVRWPAFVFL